MSQMNLPVPLNYYFSGKVLKIVMKLPVVAVQILLRLQCCSLQLPFH